MIWSWQVPWSTKGTDCPYFCIIMGGLAIFFSYNPVYLYCRIWGFKKLTAVTKIRIPTRKHYKHSVVLFSGIIKQIIVIWVSLGAQCVWKVQ